MGKLSQDAPPESPASSTILMNASSHITNLHPPRNLHRMAGRIVLCLIAGLATTHADLVEPAPTAADTQAPPPEKAPADDAAAGSKDASKAGAAAEKSTVQPPPINTPSRFISGDEVPAYVKSIASVLDISKRPTDPFGQFQDPDAKPIIKPSVVKATKQAAPVQSTPFADIIGLIQVNTIMPGERRFLIGTRSFKQGDIFPINFRGRSIKTQITAVDAREIKFRNVESGETASLTLKLLPVGMTPGQGPITPPGMVPQIPNAPIDLDPGDAHNTHP